MEAYDSYSKEEEMRRLMRAQHDGETSQSDWSEDEEVIFFTDSFSRINNQVETYSHHCRITINSVIFFFMLLEYHS